MTSAMSRFAKYSKDVMEFMDTNKQQVNIKEIDLHDEKNADMIRLRINLINEEYKETIDAIEKKDLIGTLDGFCDLLYVLHGMIHSFGIQPKLTREYRVDATSKLLKFRTFVLGMKDVHEQFGIVTNLDLPVFVSDIGETVVGYIQSVMDCLDNLTGSSDVSDQLFSCVHGSNMSKSCETLEEAEKTIAKYADQKVETVYEKIGSRYVIFNKSTKKVLKGINWSKPEPAIEGIIKKYELTMDSSEESEFLIQGNLTTQMEKLIDL